MLAHGKVGAQEQNERTMKMKGKKEMSKQKTTADALALMLERLYMVNGRTQHDLHKQGWGDDGYAFEEKAFGGEKRMKSCFARATQKLVEIGFLDILAERYRLTDMGARVIRAMKGVRI